MDMKNTKEYTNEKIYENTYFDDDGMRSWT